MKRKIVFISISVLAAGFIFIYTRPTGAQVPLFYPFGGRIITVTPCTTPPGLLLVIGPPAPRSVIVIPGKTLIFLWGSFRPGALVLGTSDVVAVPCFVGPLPAGAGFSATLIGTSP